MKTLKSILTLGVLLTTTILSASPTFEQSGVKEGNYRLSASARFSVPDEGDESLTLYGELGHYLTDDIEVAFATVVTSSDGNTFYYLKPGINYYFLKTPTLTPYVGGHIYYFDSTKDGADGTFGNNYHVGAHQFFNENFAVTAEAGLDFFEFTDYLQTYTNLSLTYFFN